MILKFYREPWDHQRKFLEEFGPKPEFFLSWEMGTGKSAAAVNWLRSKYQAHQSVTPTVIFSPLATLWNWKEEFAKNAPEGYQSLIHIAYGKDKFNWSDDARIIIVNYDALHSPRFREKIKEFNPWVVVCDESQKIKNPKSKTFKHLLTISDGAIYRGAMTGTPILNTYLDLWSQFRFLDKGKTLTPNYFLFRSKYFVDKNAGMPKSVYFPNWQPHQNTAKELTALISSKMSRVTKEECLDLPPLLFKREVVELGEEQEKAYKEMEKDLITAVKSGECAASNALVRVLRMLQIVSGHLQIEMPLFGQDSFLSPKQITETRGGPVVGTHTFQQNPRLDRLGELLEELTPQHKVIVWCTFKDNYKQIGALCDAKEIKYTTLTGETEDRQKNIQAFQTDREIRVIIANSQAGGVGVNLTAASYGIYFSRNFSLGDRLQSEARNHRGGSEIHQKITLIDLVAKDTIDEQVLEALSRKENFADNVLDHIKALR